MLSRIHQADDINTYDVGHWQLGDSLHNLPPEEHPKDTYGINIPELAEQQKHMTEWTEHLNENSQYSIINGALYSLQKPYKYAPDYPCLILPQTYRPHVMQQAHLQSGQMAALKTMHRIQDAFIWLGMKSDIMSFVAKCPKCVVHSKHVVRAPMGEINNLP